jgi:SOS-response transcriptional repressor LexA
MALNPIVFTEKVLRSFLSYQLTTYPFADQRLYKQMRQLLSLDQTRQSPLLKGPYLSLSRPFRKGGAIEDLVREGLLHPHLQQRIPQEITHLYGHQEEAIRAIRSGRTTLISTGTGSGKTECFLYPIVSKCFELRDQGATAGISAVIVYPMNALAEDQLWRLRSLLAGTGIPFGMYVGKTPEYDGQTAGIRMPKGSSRADYEAKVQSVRTEKRSETVYPPEEVCSREAMRKKGQQPRILLTNVKQLELLLTRQRDVELFADARLDFLVFDEAHTFTGAQGAETACLIRRLRKFCGKNAQDTVCVATSATIVDKDNPDAARDFASRFFGVEEHSVAAVREAYEPEIWTEKRITPLAPRKDRADILNACVKAVDDEANSDASVRTAYRDLAGTDLPIGVWSEVLYDVLSRNEILFQLSDILEKPRSLADVPKELEKKIGRQISEAETLSWLTFGAAATRQGRHLVRPVVHGFIRGISGAVASFPGDSQEPRLWLAAEDEIKAAEEKQSFAHFPISTCTTCGQHYFLAFLKDFEFTGKAPSGGQAGEGGPYWEPLEEANGGHRIVLTDRLVGGADDDDIEENVRTATLHFCRHCGTAHEVAFMRCLHCGTTSDPVRLQAIKQNEKSKGYLSSCLSCKATGRRFGVRYREPIRSVRATNVADVHVLAQDMVQHSERPRLLVFCDNRQDAAFQAGWMKDHARRFRLRALIADGLKDGPASIGDTAGHIGEILEKDEALSRALVPEVWEVVRKEGGGGRHEKERHKFLRIQVLREVTLSSRQSIGLEPWGRMKVEYLNLNVGLKWIQEHAATLGMPAEDMRDGVASILDYLRRKRVLHDPEYHLFSKYWMDGDIEVQKGYLPQLGAPTGTKLHRTPGEKNELVAQWLSTGGDTPIRQIVRKWGVQADKLETTLESMFEFLVDLKLLKPVQLTGAKGNPLPNVSEVYQVDADLLRLQTNHGVWRCRTCRRRTARRTPLNKCPSWRCDGNLEFVKEDPDNYDLQVLDQRYGMLKPEEHTAMVPHDERERLENLFKGNSDAVNAFVCTPTLELGVDIGALDAILMRNVPPLPANYWQRAGRAGRRHRMAVDITYCRPVSHDRAYFAEPFKLLDGRVDPPAFNLHNELMIAKHVHAAIVTRLHQYTRDTTRAQADREHIQDVLTTCLPDKIPAYLFAGGLVRTEPFDLTPLRRIIDQNLDDLAEYVDGAFRQGWPTRDQDIVQPDILRAHVNVMVDSLEVILARLRRRLQWALDQLHRLDKLRSKKGALEKEEDDMFHRCDQLVKRLKGTARRARREAEGYDDVNTFGVLSAEGFLPGYGLEVGSVLGTAEIPHWRTGAMEFTLPRPPSVALREYVPGNLIYANGNKFVARRFHRDVDDQRVQMPVFEVSVERQALKESTLLSSPSALSSTVIRTIAVCDVDLIHQSHISDEEELRFQMGVSTYGYERDQHNGGKAYHWGPQQLHHRRGQRLRLVNVGATTVIERHQRFGYPICTVCGQSVSPLSSERQLEEFNKQHKERCGRSIEPIGFHADIVADAFILQGCPDQTTAYSLLEALRFAATHVLDMHMEDLQLLVIGHVDRDEVDGLLWDPMPGGSGLLDQLHDHFEEIVAAACEIVEKCPSACETSCIDCLQTFRNGFYHKFLNRKVASANLGAWGPRLAYSHDIPPLQPAKATDPKGKPVNPNEDTLRHMLLAAGFGEGIRGEQIKLDYVIGTTTPDVIYRGQHHGDGEGVCIYLDSLSQYLHGNPETAKQDQLIRSWLRNNGYDVIEIPDSDLADNTTMSRHFRKLAGYLRMDALKNRIIADKSWFTAGTSAASVKRVFELHLVRPLDQDKYVTCVPLIPLKAAAGAFSGPQRIVDGDWEWTKVTSRRRLGPGMFVAQVLGKSMETAIPDGSYCLFLSPVEGSRHGRTVLVQLRDDKDPETGERYTLKRYYSEKVESEDDSWRHVKISLRPNNPEYDPIVLTCEEEGQVQVIAEMVEVLG